MKYHDFSDLKLNDLEIVFDINGKLYKLFCENQDIEITKLFSTCIKRAILLPF